MDIQVEIEPVEFDDMANRAPAESSSSIRARVMAAREIQQARFRDLPGIHCNAQMSGKAAARIRVARRSRPQKAQRPHDQTQHVSPRLRPHPARRPHHRRPGIE